MTGCAIWLVRHALYDGIDDALGGRRDHPVSLAGQRQADALAAWFRPRPVRAVVSSPVQRAQQTAAPIAVSLGLRHGTDAAFTEIDFGAWTGVPFAGLAADPAWRLWNESRGLAAVPGGEAMLDVQARAVAGLRRLAEIHSAAEVVVVSHGDVVKAVLAHVLGMPLDLLHRLAIAPASRSRIDWKAGRAVVSAVNVCIDSK